MRVTNPHDQQKARFIAFVALLDSLDPCTHVFLRFLTLQLRIENNDRADDDDDRTDYFTP